MRKVFMSYYSDEGADAEDIASHLESIFSPNDIQIIMTPRPEPARPGKIWQDQLPDTLTQSDILLVLMTVNALTRPWTNFAISIASARKAQILIFCHRGITPAALPAPYSALKPIDINGISHNQKLNQIANNVASALNIRPTKTPTPTANPPTATDPTNAILRNWHIRPTAHIGATTTATFLVGTITPAPINHAKAAGYQPGEALSVRLFLENAPQVPYINAIAANQPASLLESLERTQIQVHATIKLAAAHQERDTIIPLLAVDHAQEVPQQPTPQHP